MLQSSQNYNHLKTTTIDVVLVVAIRVVRTAEAAANLFPHVRGKTAGRFIVQAFVSVFLSLIQLYLPSNIFPSSYSSLIFHWTFPGPVGKRFQNDDRLDFESREDTERWTKGLGMGDTRSNGRDDDRDGMEKVGDLDRGLAAAKEGDLEKLKVR